MYLGVCIQELRYTTRMFIVFAEMAVNMMKTSANAWTIVSDDEY